jgi:hypothetical protein
VKGVISDCDHRASCRWHRVSGMLFRHRDAAPELPLDELAALADGSLPPRRRAELEAMVRQSPEAMELLAEQQQAVAAIRAFEPPLPPALETTVRTVERSHTRMRASGVLARSCAVGLAAAAAIVLGLVIASPDGPTVADVAAAAERPALEMHAPPGDGRGSLHRTFAGVTFPDLGADLGWHASGARRDVVDGRRMDTVYYHHHGHLVAYSVLSGPSIGLPSDGHRIVRDGVTIHVYTDGPRTVAAFERADRTCVLSGAVLSADTLVELATWRPRA